MALYEFYYNNCQNTWKNVINRNIQRKYALTRTYIYMLYASVLRYGKIYQFIIIGNVIYIYSNI